MDHRHAYIQLFPHQNMSIRLRVVIHLGPRAVRKDALAFLVVVVVVSGLKTMTKRNRQDFLNPWSWGIVSSGLRRAYNV